MVRSEDLYCYLLSYDTEYAESYEEVCEDSSICWFSSDPNGNLADKVDSFMWDTTSQGHEYWEILHEYLMGEGL